MTKNNKYTAILLLLLILLIFSVDREYNHKGNVTIFVVDTEINKQYLETGGTEYGRKITHGTRVAKLVLDETPNIDLRGISAGESQENYLSGLRQVRDFLLNNPGKRVLVNISLAFGENNSEHYNLINEINKLGAVVISAAGNDGQKKKVYPAGYDNVISVAGADQEGRVKSSNYGQHIDLAAPDELNLSSRLYLPGGPMYQYMRSRGTSFSAPRVTGLAARILSAKTNLSPEGAIELVIENCQPVTDKYYRNGFLGAGVVDRGKTLRKIDKLYLIKDIFTGYIRPLAIMLIIFFIIYFSGAPVLFLLLFLLIFQVFFPPGLYLSPGDIVLFLFSLLIVRLLTYWSNNLIFIFSIISYIILMIYYPSEANIFYVLLPMFLLTNERLRKCFLQKQKQKTLLQTLNSTSSLLRTQSRKILAKKLENGSIEQNILTGYLATNSSEKIRINIIYILAGCKFPPLTSLLHYDKYTKLIAERLLNGKSCNQNTTKKLVEFISQVKDKKRNNAVQILSHFPAKIIIPKIAEKLSNQHLQHEILYSFLQIIRAKAKEVYLISPEIIYYLIKYTAEFYDPWLRMYALRTLAAIYPEKDSLERLLHQFVNDEEALIRTEARGLLKSIADE
ncbi:MAG: S8 family serine peptidase [Halanaerobiales bacterium]